MNKLAKILIAILGGCEIVFGIFMPIAVGLMIINFFSLSGLNQSLVMIISLCTTLSKAIKIWL